nr:energy transducer TonB [Stenotrophomonas indicatrix]
MSSPHLSTIMAVRVVMAALALALAGCASSPHESSAAPTSLGLPHVSTALFIEPNDNPELPALIPPGVLNSPAPRAPADAAPLLETAEMILVVDVGAEGEVRNVMVATSTRVRDLDRAALDALRQWRFAPTEHEGSAVAVRVRVRVVFEMRDR